MCKKCLVEMEVAYNFLTKCKTSHQFVLGFIKNEQDSLKRVMEGEEKQNDAVEIIQIKLEPPVTKKNTEQTRIKKEVKEMEQNKTERRIKLFPSVQVESAIENYREFRDKKDCIECGVKLPTWRGLIVHMKNQHK